MAVVLLLPAWDCTSYDCLNFLVLVHVKDFPIVLYYVIRNLLDFVKICKNVRMNVHEYYQKFVQNVLYELWIKGETQL